MRRFLSTAAASACTFGAFAQDAAHQVVQSVEQSALQSVEPIAEQGCQSEVYLIVAAIIAVVVAMAAHMIYEHFRANLKTEYTVADFQSKRKALGLSDMTAQEVADYNSRMDRIESKWNTIYNEDGEAIPYPFRRSAVMKMYRLSKKITAANPTDKALVERINDINHTLNHALRRQFSGSKAIVIIAILVAIICGLIADSTIPAVCVGTGALLYLLSSRSATFLIAAKQAEGKEATSTLNGVISGLFIGASASKSAKAQSWTSVIIAIVVMLLGASYLALIAIVNYIRNYIIYR